MQSELRVVYQQIYGETFRQDGQVKELFRVSKHSEYSSEWIEIARKEA